MPNRIIKESLLISESYAALSLEQRDLFIRLIVAVDDYGRYDARPQVVRGRLMPLEEVKIAQVAQWLKELEQAGMIEMYTVQGRPYLRLTGWERHQSIRAKRSKFPAPQEADTPAATPENAGVTPSPEAAEGFRPPTAFEVSQYCRQMGLTVDARRFCDYYEGRGWRAAGSPVRDWHILARLWHRGSPPTTGPPQGAPIQAACTQRPHHERSSEEDADRFMAQFL